MHAHFGALGAAQAFLAVLILGTLWRLLTAHAAASSHQGLVHFAQAAAFQY
jgi:hypothetical protein